MRLRHRTLWLAALVVAGGMLVTASAQAQIRGSSEDRSNQGRLSLVALLTSGLTDRADGSVEEQTDQSVGTDPGPLSIINGAGATSFSFPPGPPPTRPPATPVRPRRRPNRN